MFLWKIDVQSLIINYSEGMILSASSSESTEMGITNMQM